MVNAYGEENIFGELLGHHKFSKRALVTFQKKCK